MDGDTDPIPYGSQWVDDEDIEAVVEALRADYLTTGPRVEAFETALAGTVDADHAVAVANGTAALHAAVHAAGLGPGAEVIVPPMTFAATANAVLYEGARPVFADVDPDHLLIDPDAVAEAITSDTEAIIAVDYAGHPVDYRALGELSDDHDLTLISDGCHALGATYHGRPVGSLADITTFSFHPVKHITTGEGGALTTDDAQVARKAARFRNHGLDSDHRQRDEEGTWFYEMVALGYNYRLSDIHCALGLSQLKKLDRFIDRRREIAGLYGDRLAGLPVEPLDVAPEAGHAYHLYMVQLDPTIASKRSAIFDDLRDQGIGVHVHYIPVHLHPYYRQHLGTGLGTCPVAEAAYERILTLPMYPGMSDDDVDRIVEALDEATP